MKELSFLWEKVRYSINHGLVFDNCHFKLFLLLLLGCSDSNDGVWNGVKWNAVKWCGVMCFVMNWCAVGEVEQCVVV